MGVCRIEKFSYTMSSATRICKRCGVEKILAKFGVRLSKKEGYVTLPICKECAAVRRSDEVLPMTAVLDRNKEWITHKLETHSINEIAGWYSCTWDTVNRWMKKNGIEHNNVGGRPRRHLHSTVELPQAEVSPYLIPLSAKIAESTDAPSGLTDGTKPADDTKLDSNEYGLFSRAK